MPTSQTADDDLFIRAAEPGDVPVLLALYEELNPGDKPLESDMAVTILQKMTRYHGSAVLVGITDEQIVSSCTLIVVPNLTRGGAPYALIENVVTRAAYRQRGYGRLILKEAVVQAWANGCYKAMLLTGSRNPGTLKFYASAGFEQSKTGFQIRRIPKKVD